MLTLGAGIGYGVVIHNDIVVDDDSGIGLVGHWPLDPFGPLCPAGHRGCARSVLTTPAIVGRGLPGCSAARSTTTRHWISPRPGNRPHAEWSTTPGAASDGMLAAVANLTAPELIVLGGEGVRLVDVAATAIDEGIAADRDPRARRISLVATSGDNTEWCRGAAVIAIQHFVLDR